MKRRRFIAGLGGAAAWPLSGSAQQPMLRIGVLMGYDETDPDAKARPSRLISRLSELGWTEGRNLSLDVRWAAGKR